MAAVVKKYCTLVLLHDAVGSRVLLGMKKRGFGSGKYNGFGGKVDPGETLEVCAVREMQEEAGITPTDLSYCGHHIFEFEGVAEELHVHIFRCSTYEGEVTESEEMAPEWFSADALPYDRMWADDRHWLPLLLAGHTFEGRFLFRGHATVVSHELRLVDKLPVDPRTDVLVTGEKQEAFLAAAVEKH